MFRIFFVLLFIFFASSAFAQPLPPLTLDECMALPCNSTEQWMDGPADLLAQLYNEATEQRNRCSSVLRKEAMRTEAAVKKIACIKARQRSLACAVSQVSEDKVPLFITMGISPSLVSIRLLIDLSSKSLAPPCASEKEIRKHYPALLVTQFRDCFNEKTGNTQSCYHLCDQLGHNVREVIPDEWGISLDEVSNFEWTSIKFQTESLDSDKELNNGPWLMCNSGVAYSP